MLINLETALLKAQQNKKAIGSFNVYNVESLQAVIKAVDVTGETAIIAFGEGYEKHMPLEVMAAMVKTYAADCQLPLVLHLDHCKSVAVIMRALRAGFTSVMYDGSALPLAENIANTKRVVELANYFGASVEGELGYMNDEAGSNAAEADSQGYTTVNAAAEFAASSGAAALAISIGNAHGIYKGTPKLDFARLDQIAANTAIPLVLHGSSGIPQESLKKAIELGIRKININTEVSTKGIAAAREFLAGHIEKNTRFEAMTKYAEQSMQTVIEEYIKLFSTASA